MATITTGGRLLAGELACYVGTTHEIQATCSLIMRHAKTLRRYDEMLCGDGIHSGEWVNDNYDRLHANSDRLENLITKLVGQLPETDGGRIVAVFQGDPRGYIVKLEVPTGTTYNPTRTVGVW
jgi:hypothetical protein